MSPVSSSSPRPGGRTFRAACVVLSGVALAQGAALAMAWSSQRTGKGAEASRSPSVVSEKKADPQADSAPTAVPPAGAEKSVAADPFASAAPFDEASSLPEETTVTTIPSPGIATAATAENGAEPLREPSAETVLARPPVKAPMEDTLDVPITDEACLRHLDEGIYLRGRGDMQGALTELRAALALQPEHPQLLYQTARTFDMMLQERRSVVLWEKLKKLGPAAGNSYQLAVTRLKELSGTAPAAPVEEEEKAGRFALGPVRVERLADTSKGEVLRFHASVKRLQADPVDATRLWLKLHLFDMVNGQRIERTTAVVAEPNWLESPVDWAEGTEDFEFEYRQAPLTVDEIVKLGQRKYYGYAVELRYGAEGDLKFEDMMAEPRELENFARELPEDAGAAGGGLEPDGGMGPPAGDPHQPDAVLFPGDKFDR